MNETMDPRRSLTLPASYIRETFIQFRDRLAQESPACQHEILARIHEGHPWLAVMLENDMRSPNEPVLR